MSSRYKHEFVSCSLVENRTVDSYAILRKLTCGSQW